MIRPEVIAQKHLRHGEVLIWADHAQRTNTAFWWAFAGFMALVLTTHFYWLLVEMPQNCPPLGTTYKTCSPFAMVWLPLSAGLGLLYAGYRLLLTGMIAKGRAHWIWALSDERVLRIITWPYVRVAGYPSTGEPPWPDAAGILPYGEDRYNSQRYMFPLVIGPLTRDQFNAMRAAWQRYDDAQTAAPPTPNTRLSPIESRHP